VTEGHSAGQHGCSWWGAVVHGIADYNLAPSDTRAMERLDAGPGMAGRSDDSHPDLGVRFVRKTMSGIT
jgi:hypothetical protein